MASQRASLKLHKAVKPKGKRDKRPTLLPGQVYACELQIADYLRVSPDGELLVKSISKMRIVCHGPTQTVWLGAESPVWPAKVDGYSNSVRRDIELQQAKPGRHHAIRPTAEAASSGAV